MNFTEKTKQRIELASLVIAAGFTLAYLFYAGGYKLDWWVFYAISPYVSICVFSRFVQPSGPAAVKAGFNVALLMLLFTVVVYALSIFVSKSSTSGLVFLFVPVFLLVVGPFVLWAFYLDYK